MCRLQQVAKRKWVILMITKEEIEEVAKELCFLLNTEHECNADCYKCEGSYGWKKYRISGRRIIKKIREMEKCRM